MLLPDVNILINSYRTEAAGHEQSRQWLEDLIYGDEAYGMSDLVCSGFLRVVTNRRIFSLPSPIDDALSFISTVRSQPNCVTIAPGPRHWDIFAELCQTSGARGNLVPDAFLAALAIESGCEWITMDGDYGRFTGLRWRRPFEGAT